MVGMVLVLALRGANHAGKSAKADGVARGGMPWFTRWPRRIDLPLKEARRACVYAALPCPALHDRNRVIANAARCQPCAAMKSPGAADEVHRERVSWARKPLRSFFGISWAVRFGPALERLGHDDKAIRLQGVGPSNP
jgi:hypothetical protein